MADSLVKRLASLGREDSRKISSDSLGEPVNVSARKRFSLGFSIGSDGGQCVITGVIYDEEMLPHENDVNSGHPECPQRIQSIWKELLKEGIIQCCRRIEARKATEEEILLVHKKTHYDLMGSTEDMPIEKLFYLALQFSSIYMNKSTMSTALYAAGSVCELTKLVLLGDLDNALAIVRPPGHHAESYKPMGFCFFNNVAIAAKMAIETFGLERVLIVDWDVHHGNGTQKMFYDDKRVLYISLHRYDNGTFFPATDDGDYTNTGCGQGEGYNINIPWNKMKMGDAEYLAAFHQIIMPIGYEFNPELVLISAGFDSGEGDPLGGYGVSPHCYGHLTHMLKGLANGKLVVALEGGYNLTTISNSMRAVAEVLLGDSPRGLETTCVPNPSAMMTIRNVCVHVSSYWKSLSHWNESGLPDMPQEPALKTEDTITNIVENGNDTTKPEITKANKLTTQPPKLNGIVSTEEDEYGRTKGASSPNLRDMETPPPGSVPVSTAKMPLSEAQRTMIEALEQDGNVCMFAVSPKAWCQHLESIVSFPTDTIDTKALCEVCQTPRENWVCLTCHRVLCGRYINKHMVQHNEETEHSIALSFADLSVWCFPCDSYVHNPVLQPFINKAHVNKFGSS